jgi:hypothetical protein
MGRPIESPDDIESPRLRGLYDVWAAACGARPWPLRAAIDPVRLPRELLPLMFLADVEGDPPDFRFRLAGTSVVEHTGVELTGRRLSALPLKGLDPVLEEYRKAVADARPRWSMLQYVSANGYLRTVERVVLPLSRGGDACDMLVGAFEYHRDPADWEAGTARL